MRQLKPYQREACTWLLERALLFPGRGAALFLDPGMGKTAITLHFLSCYLKPGEKVLLVAPGIVCDLVWKQEAALWNLGLNIINTRGTPKQRVANFQKQADVYLINAENLEWLSGQSFDFDHLVIDESTVFKTWSAKRTKAMRRMLKDIPGFRLILTGTPTSNSYIDLFSQQFIVDDGEALGKNITAFRKKFCHQAGFKGYNWILNPGASEVIQDLVAPSCFRRGADELGLDDMLVHTVPVQLPSPALKQYRQFQRDLEVELEGEKIMVDSAGASYVKCRQFIQGHLEDKKVHMAKIEALSNLWHELHHKPLLIAYPFREDAKAIEAHLKGKGYKYAFINGEIQDRTRRETAVAKWNAGELDALVVNPQALSFGLNLQHGPGRDIVWYGLTDDYTAYSQLNKRIHRLGVTGVVRIHNLVAVDTIDEAIEARLQSKAEGQEGFFDFLKAYLAGETINA